MLLTRDCHFTTVNLPLVGKKKKTETLSNDGLLNFLKTASIDDATNDTPRRELIWNEGTNQRATQIYTTLPSPRSHRFVTVRDWPLPCAPTPHWSRESAALPIFSHSTLLSSPSLRPKMHFSREMSQQHRLMHASTRKLSVVISSRKFGRIGPLWTSTRWWTSILQKGYRIVFSLYVSKYTLILGLYSQPFSCIIREENWKLMMLEWYRFHSNNNNLGFLKGKYPIPFPFSLQIFWNGRLILRKVDSRDRIVYNNDLQCY